MNVFPVDKSIIVSAPAAGPNGFFYFFFDRGGNGAVPDISINFTKKLRPQSWFAFGMVDVV
jgi:hypothetical protein